MQYSTTLVRKSDFSRNSNSNFVGKDKLGNENQNLKIISIWSKPYNEIIIISTLTDNEALYYGPKV